MRMYYEEIPEQNTLDVYNITPLYMKIMMSHHNESNHIAIQAPIIYHFMHQHVNRSDD